MNSKKYSAYQKRILDKWAKKIGFDQLHTWLIPAIERFAQGRAVGMGNGAPVRDGERPTIEDKQFGYKQLRTFCEALKDFDWLLECYEEWIPV